MRLDIVSNSILAYHIILSLDLGFYLKLLNHKTNHS